MLVVATGVTQAPNDKQQVEPILATLQAQTVTRGEVDCLIADTGYCSEHNVQACAAVQIEPLICVARQSHHISYMERHSEPAPLAPEATPMQSMMHRLKTKAGRATYALRKQTVEPVFGIIKSVLGFRQFSLRGLAKVTGEWSLPGVEYQAHGGTPSKIWITRGNTLKNRKNSQNHLKICLFFKQIENDPVSKG